MSNLLVIAFAAFHFERDLFRPAKVPDYFRHDQGAGRTGIGHDYGVED